ncbi:MAG: hypothetical protein M3502_09595, partial [Actinomycetota bacterium]|nr:hypothetical protein [Actinomycetota bacterium]
MNTARTAIDPPLTPTLQRVTMDSERVVWVGVGVGVGVGVEKPYALRSGESRRCLRRGGSLADFVSRDLRRGRQLDEAGAAARSRAAVRLRWGPHDLVPWGRSCGLDRRRATLPSGHDD